MKTIRAFLALTVLLVQSLCGAQGRMQAEELEALLAAGRPGDTVLRMSPDGKYVAELTYIGEFAHVIMTDLQTGLQWELHPNIVTPKNYAAVQPVAIHWVGDDILVVDYHSKPSVSFTGDGKRLATLGERFIRGVAVQGSLREHALVYRDVALGAVDVVNARTGERRSLEFPMPGKPVAWAFDAVGALRAVTMAEQPKPGAKRRYSNWYRTDEKDPWRLLEAWSQASPDAWMPVHAGSEPDSIVVMSRRDRDTLAVFRYDTVERRLVQLIAGHPTEDIVYASGLDRPQIEGYLTEGMKRAVHWSDARWAAVQAAVDAALPDRINLVSGNKEGKVLVFSASDVDPGRWYVLDTRTSKMFQLREAVRRLSPEAMRKMAITSFVARDGKRIPAYLTLPAGDAAKPAPTVVLVHDGPDSRHEWKWNREVQILAKSGYAVFQPQFRGSAGFGRRFAEAGHRQWGRAMQDDLTDGVRHLIDQGIADPARICIYGAGYGGYAALWAAIQTPELYRCAVSLSGISDPVEWVSAQATDDSTSWDREVRQYRIGDPVTDRARLEEVSPLEHAGKTGIPVLIAHGERDRQVPPSQSEAMVRALRAAGRPVEWLPVPNEGHTIEWYRGRERFFKALLGFLDRHIGERDPAPHPEATAPK